ncbi:MAG: TlpA disulfide reductase family protein [Candidatus Omnitrophica bacterium]|nr:TlpA disulfide reductase family protein [Candidatus Omnitrophota bacterium]
MRKIFLAISILAIASCAYAQNDGFYTLSGKEVTLEKITTAPKAVLFLWTTWCPYCRREIARLDTDFPNIANEENFYSVNISERRSTVEAFIKKMNLPAKITDGILLDPEGKLANKYSVVSIPVFLVLKNGKIVYREHFLDQETLNNL